MTGFTDGLSVRGGENREWFLGLWFEQLCVVEGSLDGRMGKWRMPCIGNRSSAFVEVLALQIMARGETNKVGEMSSYLPSDFPIGSLQVSLGLTTQVPFRACPILVVHQLSLKILTGQLRYY